MNEAVRLRYAHLAKSGLSPSEFYANLLHQKVSKFDIFVLLRDEFSLGLAQCIEIADEFQRDHTVT